MRNRNNTTDFFSAAEISFARQDTTLTQQQSLQVLPQDTAKSNITTRDTVNLKLNTIQQIDFTAIDSILKQSEAREKQIEQQRQQEQVVKKWYKPKIDTTEVLYDQFGIAEFPVYEKLKQDPFSQNFLYNIPVVKPEQHKAKQTVFIEDSKGVTETAKSYQNTTEIKDFEVKEMPGQLHFDWITIVLIGSFLLLGWIRLFNKKYLGSLVKAAVSYKESNTLYRERNSLMEKASFLVNILFMSNMSIFAVQLKHLWNIKMSGLEDWVLYLIVYGFLLLLYVFRAITSTFIGYLFMKQAVFNEYFHNVNIYTKNKGLFLFPVVIALQFLSYQFLNIIAYVGISIIAALYLLMLLRSFQIIIRKNVSIFYMILYLCAFEFAPFLILYKILLSLS